MSETARLPDSRGILYPPGGAFICSLVLLELLTFSFGLIAFFVAGKNDSVAFAESCQQLKPLYGLTNTIVLLTSGYFTALSVAAFTKKDKLIARRFIGYALIGGIAFLLIKGVEYQEKIAQGFTLGYDVFFTYYWLLSVFHLMHVIAGMVILLVLRRKLTTAAAYIETDDYEAGAVFWHMCDLIWLILFPALYLVF